MIRRDSEWQNYGVVPCLVTDDLSAICVEVIVMDWAQRSILDITHNRYSTWKLVSQYLPSSWQTGLSRTAYEAHLTHLEFKAPMISDQHKMNT